MANGAACGSVHLHTRLCHFLYIKSISKYIVFIKRRVPVLLICRGPVSRTSYLPACAHVLRTHPLVHVNHSRNQKSGRLTRWIAIASLTFVGLRPREPLDCSDGPAMREAGLCRPPRIRADNRSSHSQPTTARRHDRIDTGTKGTAHRGDQNCHYLRYRGHVIGDGLLSMVRSAFSTLARVKWE